MADALKTFFSPSLVRRLAEDLARVHPAFPTKAFVKDACAGLDALTFTLRSTSRATQPQDLLIDVAVHFVKARGVTAAKVFKLKRLTLAARQQVELQISFSLAIHTTRVPQPGVHAVDVIVNGQRMPAGSFTVSAAK